MSSTILLSTYLHRYMLNMVGCHIYNQMYILQESIVSRQMLRGDEPKRLLQRHHQRFGTVRDAQHVTSAQVDGQERASGSMRKYGIEPTRIGDFHGDFNGDFMVVSMGELRQKTTTSEDLS